MQYNGKKVIEIFPKDWDGTARTLLTWNFDTDTPSEKKVYGYDTDKESWICDGGMFAKYYNFAHVGYADANVCGFAAAFEYVHGKTNESIPEFIVGSNYICVLPCIPHGEKLDLARCVSYDSETKHAKFLSVKSSGVYINENECSQIIPTNLSCPLEKHCVYRATRTSGETLDLIFDGESFTDYLYYYHISGIVKIETTARATNEEMTQWLAKGNGVYRRHGSTCEYSNWPNLTTENRKRDVDLDVEVRWFGTDVFGEPTRSFMRL